MDQKPFYVATIDGCAVNEPGRPTGVQDASGARRLLRIIGRAAVSQDPIVDWTIEIARVKRIQQQLHSLCLPVMCLSVVLLGLSLVPVTSAAESDADGWIVLFDGKNLDAWQMSPTARWKIEEGTIALQDRTDGSLKNEDYLWTNETYGDFILELEFKTCEGHCNSGVFLRTADRADPVYTGIEMQVSNSQGQAVSRGGTAGAIYDCCAPKRNTVLPAGQWNHCRVICRGARIAVALNGEEILEMDLDRWTETGRNPDGTTNKFTRPLKDFARVGHIGLQDHGRPVWYRNVRVKRLDQD